MHTTERRPHLIPRQAAAVPAPHGPGPHRLIADLPTLDEGHPLPEAPWFEPGAAWSTRRVLIHILAETAQHCGHADIIRESIDGQKTMG